MSDNSFTTPEEDKIIEAAFQEVLDGYLPDLRGKREGLCGEFKSFQRHLYGRKAGCGGSRDLYGMRIKTGQFDDEG